MKHPLRHICVTLLLASYLLGIKNGQVALWNIDDPQPIKIFPWSAVMLPGQIRQALEKGIVVEAESDIGKLIAQMIS